MTHFEYHWHIRLINITNIHSDTGNSSRIYPVIPKIGIQNISLSTATRTQRDVTKLK